MERKTIELIVNRRIPFYQKLSVSGKKKFIDRLSNHYSSKEFVGVKGQVITREIKTLVSAAAAQLTFGMSHSFLTHFDTYYIHSKPFKLYPKYPLMHGATVPSGELHFNWAKVEDGYEDYTDGINLAIHEFAHALVVQHRQGVIEELEWIGEYNYWFSKTQKELRKKDVSERKYFRRNILKTPTEMFPIIVEEFFERPEELKYNWPVIYQDMVELLNLDILNEKYDYSPYRGFSFGLLQP